jgi:Transcriptional regulator
MASDEIKRNRILEFSFKKFTTVGIPNVTMDEISRGVGIGKGTLYKFFPSKEDLLFKTIEFFAGKVEKAVQKIIADESLSSVEKLNLVLKTIGEKLALINPSALEYLERSFPEAFEKIDEVRRRVIMTNLVGLFDEGKQNGIFQPDMDTKLVAHILIGAANHIVDAKVLSTMNYSIENLFRTMTSILLKGCLTEEGRKLAFENN